MIVGGANQPFETTFRVLAFTQGSTGPLQMIPICGGVIAGVWAIVCYCIGLARAHGTDTGRAVLAVFTSADSLLRRRSAHRIYVYGRLDRLASLVFSACSFLFGGSLRANLVVS